MLKDISERVSYLQGLSEGMNLTSESPHGKIISGMLNVMNDMAEEIIIMQEDMEDVKEYIESIDDDLYDLEETILDDEFLELKCSNCGETLYIERDILQEEEELEIICPACNEVVFVNDSSFDFDHIPCDMKNHVVHRNEDH